MGWFCVFCCCWAILKIVWHFYSYSLLESFLNMIEKSNITNWVIRCEINLNVGHHWLVGAVQVWRQCIWGPVTVWPDHQVLLPVPEQIVIRADPAVITLATFDHPAVPDPLAWEPSPYLGQAHHHSGDEPLLLPNTPRLSQLVTHQPHSCTHPHTSHRLL